MILKLSKNVKLSSSIRGFTILEILVVVAVISIIASTILLNTSFHRPATELKKHASNLGKTLQLLMQEAILEDRNFALSVVPKGYMVLEYEAQEWIQSADKFLLKLGKEHEYSDELMVDNNPVNIEKTEQPQPHILILASGEMSVFQWDIEDRENNLHIRLSSTMLGNITIEGPSDNSF